jgi:uncharacterized protein DUF4397
LAKSREDETKFVFTNKSGVLLMRLSRFVMLCFATAALNACGDDEVTAPSLPPLAEVRFINAVNDTGGVDIHPVDFVELWAPANNLQYRAATEYFPTKAGVRHLRVFPTSTDISVTSQIMDDELITLVAGNRYTLLLAGSARAKTARLWLINDGSTPPPAGQISVRMGNAAGGIVNGYLVNTATTPLPGTPTYTNLGAVTLSPYVNRATGVAAIRVTDAGSTAVNASGAGPAAPATLSGQKPAAGVGSQGTAFSVYYFAAGAAGSANASVASPSVIWFVDRNPCDEPAVAACNP